MYRNKNNYLYFNLNNTKFLEIENQYDHKWYLHDFYLVFNILENYKPYIKEEGIYENMI